MEEVESVKFIPETYWEWTCPKCGFANTEFAEDLERTECLMCETPFKVNYK